jgi:hypothetical protein
MAKRTKRRVKQRSKAHRKWVGAKRKVKKHSNRKVRYGTKKRRAKKARKARNKGRR